MRIRLTLLLLIVVHASIGQTSKSNFSLIDKRVKSIQPSPVDNLSRKLTSPYKTQLEKVRSIFRWITENIEYDVVGYHNGKDIYEGLFRPGLSTIDSIVQKDYNDRIVEKVLTEKKAICDGYARLFKTLCDKANIPSVVISGYARRYSDPIGVVTERGHAWNAVFIDNKWQLLDPTWASGYVNESETKFFKEYDNFYFLTDPVKFFNNHYPSDPKWSLLPNTPSRQQFYGYPYFYPDFYASQITFVQPTNGIIDITPVNKKVRIELESDAKVKELDILEYPYHTDTAHFDSADDTLSFEELEKKYAPKFKIIGRKIYWDYEIQSPQTERLDILFNNKLVLSYRVRRYQ